MVAERESLDPFGKIEGHTPVETYDPDEEERKLVSLCRQRFDEMDGHRSSWEARTKLYKARLRGDQIVRSLERSDEMLRVNVLGDSRNARRSQENLLRENARALVGKHTRVIPAFGVRPASEDETDMRASRVAESLLEYIARKEKLRVKYVKVHRQLMYAGTGIWTPRWNPRGGLEVAFCAECDYEDDVKQEGEECPRCAHRYQVEAEMANQEAIHEYQGQVQEAGFEAQQAAALGAPPPMMPQEPEPVEAQPGPPLERANKGDIEVGLTNPEDFFPEPGVEEITDMRYFCIRKALPVSEIRETFPHMALFIAAEEGIEWDRSITFDGSTLGSPESHQYNDHAYLYEWHEKPTDGWPDGRILFECNGMILNFSMDADTGEKIYGDDHPTYRLLGRLPAYRFRWETNDGDFWGEAPIEQAAHVQDERNDLLTDMNTQRKFLNKPPLLVPLQGQIGEGDFKNLYPGKPIKYSRMHGKPEYLQAPEFPQYTYQELQRMAESVRGKFSVTEQELGGSSGDPSGRYAAILESQSSETIGPIIVENNEEYKELHRAILLIAQEFYDDDRTWTIEGRDRVRTYAWRDANLRPGWDITLVGMDSLSKNPALRKQQVDQMAQMGYFTDPMTGMPDWDRYARMAGIQESRLSPDQESAERAYAANLPAIIEEATKSGEPPPPPQMWDDAKIMTEELGLWLRGKGRQKDTNPQLKQIIQNYWLYYAYMVRPVTPDDARFLPQQQPQPGQGGPQGPSMGAGAVPGQRDSQGEEAADVIQQADQQAEREARGDQKHEG